MTTDALDTTMDDPRNRPVRFSALKNIARSPAHYLESLRHHYDSAALRRGRLVDMITFGETPLVFDGTRRGKEWQAFVADHPDQDIYTQSEYDDAEPIAASLRRPEHAHALDLLSRGAIKERFSWRWLDRDCRGEPDVAGDVLVDLKTTRNADPQRFSSDALRYAYHAQLAWYRNGLVCAGRPAPTDCYIVAVETKPPYPVVVLRLTPHVLDLGERLCRLWMEQLLECERSGHWPGYAQGVIDLDAPEELDLDYGDEEAA